MRRKVYNLRRAVEALPEQFEVIVFTDSDVRLSRGWLGKLVAPLQDPRIGATTTYRWLIPSRRIGEGGLRARLPPPGTPRSSPCLAGRGETFCWGGGTAIRRKTFDEANVLEAWQGAVSDDFAMTLALEQAGKSVLFCPECLAATLHPWTGTSLLEFTNRQMLITRVYSRRRWDLGAIAHGGYSLTLIYAAIVILITMAAAIPGCSSR